jgi:hypothetical protein
LFALGGHTLDVTPLGTNPSTSEIADVHLRKLFWLMYMFDKELTLRTGQPPKISDEYCNLNTPSDRDNVLAATSVSDKHGSYCSDPWIPGIRTLSILRSKIFRLLYSFEAFCKSETELLMAIRELDEELESWRQSVPAERRPDLTASHTKALSGVRRDGKTVHHMLHHLEYHHLMMIIHSASSRCRKAPGNTSETNIIGLQSSLELSVQASRVSLAIIRAGAQRFPTQAFW